MAQYVPSDYRIDFAFPPEGPEFVDQEADLPVALEAVSRHIGTIDPDECDVLLIGEAMDVVVSKARSVARVPIVGPGEETLRVAALAARPVSVMVMNRLDAGLAEEFLGRATTKPDGVAIRSLDTPLGELVKDLDRARQALWDEATAAVENDGAEGLYLGAMTLTTLGVTDRLRRELGVAVYDPVRIGLKVAVEVVQSLVGDV